MSSLAAFVCRLISSNCLRLICGKKGNLFKPINFKRNTIISHPSNPLKEAAFTKTSFTKTALVKLPLLKLSFG